MKLNLKHENNITIFEQNINKHKLTLKTDTDRHRRDFKNLEKKYDDLNELHKTKTGEWDKEEESLKEKYEAKLKELREKQSELGGKQCSHELKLQQARV